MIHVRDIEHKDVVVGQLYDCSELDCQNDWEYIEYASDDVAAIYFSKDNKVMYEAWCMITANLGDYGEAKSLEEARKLVREII